MKKGIIYLMLLLGFITNAQQKEDKKSQEKDTIKTEIIEVISTYNPTIADAFKIKKNPKNNELTKRKRKKLNYTIYSAPVASTFIPKSGVLKGVTLEKKEQIFNNYVAAGYGNFNTPYLEAFFNKSLNNNDEFGLYTKYESSDNGVKNAILDNGFSNLSFGGFYAKEERNFDWKLGINAFQNRYNWYGLPTSTITFDPNTFQEIDENIRYTFYEIEGEIMLQNSNVKNIKSKLSIFGDGFNSDEFNMSLSSDLKLPLNKFFTNFNDLDVNVKLEVLNGDFNLNYASNSLINYSFFNVSAHSVYRFKKGNFTFKIGTKAFLAFDVENSITDFLMYPDISISTPLVPNFASIYAGVDGGLTLNSFNNFTTQNPFVSPTLFLTQTNEQYNFYGGLKGAINSTVSFDVKASYKSVEDQPLFFRNNSKSDGNPMGVNQQLRGFEYGNSFSVIYDDIETISLTAEIEMMLSKEFSFGANAAYYNYTLTNQQKPWNLPNFEAGATLRYKKEQWYLSSDIFYVGEREDVLYSGNYISSISGTQKLESFADINLNAGYHFTPSISAFVRLNNILNSNYERFANFNVQGFQILGGLTYKFDF